MNKLNKINFFDAMDALNSMGEKYSGELLFLKEINDENKTYEDADQAGEAYKAENGYIFVNKMMDTEQNPQLEITLLGIISKDELSLLLKIYTKKNIVFYIEEVRTKTDLLSKLSENSLRVESISDENEYILNKEGMRFSDEKTSAFEVIEMHKNEIELAKNSNDENTAYYGGKLCDELPKTVKGMCIIREGELTGLCVIEYSDNGYRKIAEPIWIYVDEKSRGLKIGQTILRHFCLSHRDSDYTCVYRCESENVESYSLAEKCGFELNRVISCVITEYTE